VGGAASVALPAAAAIALIADAALTGMLHLDGLADAADGLLPPFACPSLEVMADLAPWRLRRGGPATVLLAPVSARSRP
jgi:cobalamin synthase